MIYDSHIHIDIGEEGIIGIEKVNPLEFGEFKELIESNRLGVLANASCVKEYEKLSQLENAHISFGIHPWSTDEFCAGCNTAIEVRDKVMQLEAYYKNAEAIGEIGMDSVWCECDMERQQWLFEAQLYMAESLNKPIVLHIKGMEKEAAEILKGYSVKKLVHWYSCEEHLDKFIEQDCYFTIGPDFKKSRAVQQVVKMVSKDRLLVETDGTSAVQWAVGKSVSPVHIPVILRETISAAAKQKGINDRELEAQMEANFHRFMG